MSIRRLLTQEVGHVKGQLQGEDEYNNPVYNRVVEPITGLLQQFAEREAIPDTQPKFGRGRLYLSPDEFISNDDSFIIDGTQWYVYGHPRRVFNPRLRRYSHWELQVVTGGDEDAL